MKFDFGRLHIRVGRLSTGVRLPLPFGYQLTVGNPCVGRREFWISFERNFNPSKGINLHHTLWRFVRDQEGNRIVRFPRRR